MPDKALVLYLYLAPVGPLDLVKVEPQLLILVPAGGVSLRSRQHEHVIEKPAEAAGLQA